MLTAKAILTIHGTSHKVPVRLFNSNEPMLLCIKLQFPKHFPLIVTQHYALSLIELSSLYPDKARALRHARALLSYNARCLRHKLVREQIGMKVRLYLRDIL